MKIPLMMVAGDSGSWDDTPWCLSSSHEQYTSAEWTLNYYLRGPSQLTVVGVANGDGWHCSISATDSASLLPGQYAWSAKLSMQDHRMTIGQGTLTVSADLSAGDGAIDARSVAERALADCEAALASFKGSGGKIKSYSIGTRQTEFHSLIDLMALRQFWQQRVNSERARQVIANGGQNPRRLLVRFK
jgi:hypothetical protein